MGGSSSKEGPSELQISASRTFQERIKNYNYDNVDFMDKNNSAWKNKTYKTIYL